MSLDDPEAIELLDFVASRLAQLRPSDPIAALVSLIAEYDFCRGEVFKNLTQLRSKLVPANFAPRVKHATEVERNLKSLYNEVATIDAECQRFVQSAPTAEEKQMAKEAAGDIDQTVAHCLQLLDLCGAYLNVENVLEQMSEPGSWKHDLSRLSTAITLCAEKMKTIWDNPLVQASSVVVDINTQISALQRAIPYLLHLQQCNKKHWKAVLALPDFEYEHKLQAAIRAANVPQRALGDIMQLLHVNRQAREEISACELQRLREKQQEAAAKVQAKKPAQPTEGQEDDGKRAVRRKKE